MKKIFLLGLVFTLLLTGCAPQFDEEEEVVEDTEDTTEKATIPSYQISDEYYKTPMPFTASSARGLVVSNLNTRYDIEEFETGLLRVAQNDFSTDKYLFKEGQLLSTSTINKWLSRKYTAEQLKEKKITEEDNIGLNPIDTGEGDIAKRSKESPIYLAHILEHNYYVQEDDKISLGGVVIGLALNSVYYYQKEAYGATYEEKISHKDLVAQGEKIADEVLKRIQGMEGMEGIPVTIALFEQKEKSSVVPGNFIEYAHIDNGKTSINKWNSVNEKYYLFPSTVAEDTYRVDVTTFKNFKQDVEEYFPNFNGIVGRAFYANKQLQELNIDIPIQFYGNTEAISFTQYVTTKVMEHFPEYITVQVSITSVNGAEALIVRKSGEAEPFVHIYQ